MGAAATAEAAKLAAANAQNAAAKVTLQKAAKAELLSKKIGVDTGAKQLETNSENQARDAAHQAQQAEQAQGAAQAQVSQLSVEIKKAKNEKEAIENKLTNEQEAERAAAVAAAMAAKKKADDAKAKADDAKETAVEAQEKAKAALQDAQKVGDEDEIAAAQKLVRATSAKADKARDAASAADAQASKAKMTLIARQAEAKSLPKQGSEDVTRKTAEAKAAELPRPKLTRSRRKQQLSWQRPS